MNYLNKFATAAFIITLLSLNTALARPKAKRNSAAATNARSNTQSTIGNKSKKEISVEIKFKNGSGLGPILVPAGSLALLPENLSNIQAIWVNKVPMSNSKIPPYVASINYHELSDGTPVIKCQ